MPVNFGILQQIPTPQVSGTIAPSSGGGGGGGGDLNSLAGGIMSGFTEMQRTRNQTKQVENDTERLGMEKEKHSYDIKEAKRKDYIDEEMLKVKKQQYQEAQTLDDKALTLLGPEKAALIQSQRATTMQTLNEVTKGNVENNLMVVDLIASANGLANQAEASGAPPEQVQQIYQAGLAILPKEIKPLAEQLLNNTNSMKYTKENALMWTGLGREAEMKFMLSRTGTLPKSGESINEAQKQKWHKDSIAELTNQIADAKKKGQDTSDMESELDAHKKGLVDNARGKKSGEGDDRTADQKNIQRRVELKDMMDKGKASDADKQEYYSLAAPAANVLRDEFNQGTGSFQKINDSYNRIFTVAKENTDKAGKHVTSYAGDLAITYGYIKMLDEITGVKDAELATTSNLGSLLTKAKSTYDNLIKGKGGLTNEQRDDILKQAKSIYGAYEKTYNKRVKDYTEKAQRQGLDPKDVIADVRPDNSQGAGTVSSVAGAVPEGRIEVKDKNGNSFHIPKEQLQEAISAGYNPVGGTNAS